MLGFSNKELSEKPSVGKGSKIICDICDQIHEARLAVNSNTGQESDMLVFVTCPTTNKSYLVGVAGRLVNMKMVD